MRRVWSRNRRLRGLAERIIQRHSAGGHFAPCHGVQRFGADVLTDEAFLNDKSSVVLTSRVPETLYVLRDYLTFGDIHRRFEHSEQCNALLLRLSTGELLIDLFDDVPPIDERCAWSVH